MLLNALIVLACFGVGFAEISNSVDAAADLGYTTTDQPALNINQELLKGLVIYSASNVNEELQNYAVVVAMRAIGENPDYQSVARKLVDAMNRRYRRYWMAIVGRTEEWQAHVEIPLERALVFEVNQVIFSLYKVPNPALGSQVIVNNHNQARLKSEFEVIKEARKNIHRLKIEDTEMTHERQREAIRIIVDAVQNKDSYVDIAKLVTAGFEAKYGENWNAAVGFDQFNAHVTYSEMNFMKIRFHELLVYVYQS